MTALRIERLARRRGAFGLDERRRPDPGRVEEDLRRLLALRLPEVWPLPAPRDHAGSAAGDEGSGRTLALLLPRGHVAVLRIERDRDCPGATSRALAERCRAMHIPHATVSSVAEGRAALRRLGVDPRPQRVADGPTLDSVFGRA